jgi:hypothetical protein
MARLHSAISLIATASLLGGCNRIGGFVDEPDYFFDSIVTNKYCSGSDYRQVRRTLGREVSRRDELEAASQWTYGLEEEYDKFAYAKARRTYCEQGSVALEAKCDAVSSLKYGARRAQPAEPSTHGNVGTCQAAAERLAGDPIVAAEYADALWNRYLNYRAAIEASADALPAQARLVGAAESAARSGHEQGNLLYCRIVLELRRATAYQQAESACRAAWSSGANGEAAALLGYYYDSGFSGTRDISLAARWYRSALDKGMNVGQRLAALERESTAAGNAAAATSSQPPDLAVLAVIGGSIACLLWKSCRDTAVTIGKSVAEAEIERRVREAETRH